MNRFVVVAPSCTSMFAAQIQLHLRSHLAPNEQMMVFDLTDTASEQGKSMQEILKRERMAVLICISVRPHAEIISTCRRMEVPVILVDEEAAGAGMVAADNFQGGQLASEYLIKKGRTRLAIISGKTEIEGGYNAKQRVNGFLKALADQGLPVPGPENRIEVSQYSKEEGYEFGKLLFTGRTVDGVFCAAGDDCAGGVLRAAKECGVAVPKDVSLIGYDDLAIARLFRPPLTTIRQPLAEMAKAAYQMACERAQTLSRPGRAILPSELVARESA